jgi:hypothetical protein
MYNLFIIKNLYILFFNLSKNNSMKINNNSKKSEVYPPNSSMIFALEVLGLFEGFLIPPLL